jgi:hypothetical protein
LSARCHRGNPLGNVLFEGYRERFQLRARLPLLPVFSILLLLPQAILADRSIGWNYHVGGTLRAAERDGVPGFEQAEVLAFWAY